MLSAEAELVARDVTKNTLAPFLTDQRMAGKNGDLSQFITIDATHFSFFLTNTRFLALRILLVQIFILFIRSKTALSCSYPTVKTSSLLDPSLLLPRVAYSNNTMGRTVDQEVHAAFVEFRAKEDDKVKPLYFLYLGNISTQY